MLLCDFIVFWARHFQRPTYEQVLAVVPTERDYYREVLLHGLKIKKPKRRWRKRK